MFHFEQPLINSETTDLLHELFDSFDGTNEQKNQKTQYVLENLIEENQTISTNINNKLLYKEKDN